MATRIYGRSKRKRFNILSGLPPPLPPYHITAAGHRSRPTRQGSKLVGIERLTGGILQGLDLPSMLRDGFQGLYVSTVH